MVAAINDDASPLRRKGDDNRLRKTMDQVYGPTFNPQVIQAPHPRQRIVLTQNQRAQPRTSPPAHALTPRSQTGPTTQNHSQTPPD